MDNSNKMETLLNHLRRGSLPENTEYEEAVAIAEKGLESDDEDRVDKSLLAFFYLSRLDDVRSGDLKPKVKELGESYRGESKDKILGRKVWIHTGILMENHQYKQVVATACELERREVSLYVWDRFFIRINSFPSSYRLYPALTVPLLDKSDLQSYRDYINDQEIDIYHAASLISHYREALPESIDRICSGEGDTTSVEELIKHLSGSGLDLLSIWDQFCEKFPHYPYRFRLIHSLFLYLVNLPDNASDQIPALVRYGIAFFNYLDDDDRSLYERCSLLLLRSYGAEEKEIGSLASEISRFLREEDEEGELNNSLEQDLQTSFQSVLIKWIGEKSMDQKAFDSMGRLLDSSSLYFQNMGASLILEGIRNGYDAKASLPLMIRLFKENPDTKNSMTEGSDISDKDREFAYTLFSPKAFIGEEKSSDGGFFNLDGLTGLLAMCQPPSTALRLKLAFELMGMDPENLPEIKQEPERLFVPGVIGPLDFTGILERFNKWSEMSEEELKPVLIDDRESLAATYGFRISGTRRNMIKSVFEGDIPVKMPGLIEQTWMDIQEKDFPGPFCQNNDENPDSLAYYLPRISLSDEDKPFCGIYFHYYRMRDFAERNNLSLEDAVKAVFVHELFHAFVENCLDRMNVEAEGRPGGFCRLEEAAANKSALLWSEDHLRDDSREKLREALFQSGNPGYGEYDRVIDPPELWIPFMLALGKDIPLPEAYSAVRNQLLLEGRGSEQQLNKAVWLGFLNSFTETQVPLYLDLRCVD